jgi:hypothetical protein
VYIYHTELLLAYFSYFEKNKSRLMRSSCFVCVCVCVCLSVCLFIHPNNFENLNQSF